jgi:septum formation protein
MKKIILASASPRRIEILKGLKLQFDIVPSTFEETIVQKSPVELVCELARGKALAVASNTEEDSIIIAADTIVYKDDEIFGKPNSKSDACRILKKLSGCSHSVLTGVCLIDTTSGKTIVDYEETKVYFKTLSDEEIESYIASGEPEDKAGAYAIQGLGSLFVRKIEGCYFNVVGLPIFKLNILLGEMGINLL